MKASKNDRRDFIKKATNALGGMAILSALPASLSATAKEYICYGNEEVTQAPSRIKFAVIGINHGHIYSQVDIVMKGGGALVAFHAKEPDLAADLQSGIHRRSLSAVKKKSWKIDPFN